MEAGSTAEHVVELPEGGFFALGPGGDRADLRVEVTPGGATSLRWEEGASGVVQVAPGLIQLFAHNSTSMLQRVILADASADRQVAPASLVSTMPEFRRQFGVQALAPNVRIAVRSVALLFTDLSGSTAMYRALGDAQAYGLVRDHFTLVTGVITSHGGVLVKTIGDAVMASFHHASGALTAAMALRGAFHTWIAEQGVAPAPRLNIGVHVGPALAVHSDLHGMDWFGSTVNLAARAQSAAKDGAIVLTQDVVDDPVVAEQLRALDPPLEAFDAELKGIGALRLWRIQATFAGSSS